MRFFSGISHIAFRKARGDYFFFLLLILGVAVNFYFEMDVNGAIKTFTNNHEKVQDQRTRAARIFLLGRSMTDLESLVIRYARTGDTSYLSDIRYKEKKLERDIVVLTQQLKDIVSETDILELRRTLQKRSSFVHSVLETSESDGRTAAMELMFSGRGMDIQKDLSTQYERVHDHAQAGIEKLELQLQEDRREIIAIDYAMPHLISFVFLVIAGFILFKIFQVNKLNSSLQEAVENEKKAQQVKDEFMDNMTHELRSPLNSVLGYSSLLSKTTLTGDQERFVRSIRTSGEHLLNVINEVLDLSKIRSGYIQISKEPFSLREQLDTLGNIISDKILEKDLFFECQVDETVPDDLLGDRGKLLQVLLNLTSNALKFTRQGGITVEVTCKEILENQALLTISVSDTGTGIPADKLPHIFERFYQVESSGVNAEHVGTGLGLSITREMLALQGGRIQVQSQPGKGSTFKVEIPYDLAEKKSSREDADERQGTSLRRQLPYSTKVLVVDDNALNRELIAFMLRDLGIKYSLAGGGAEALAILARESFSVVLMDLQMPEMDGRQTTAKIREDLKLDVPIVALSAYAQQQEKQKCLEGGMDAYLTKPLKESELFDMLEMCSEDEGHATVNISYLRRMSRGNVDFINSVILRVADNLPQEIEGLKNAMIDNDRSKVNKIAHDMKTTFGVLGVGDHVNDALEYLEQWEPAPAAIIKAGKMLKLIEDVGARVTFQLLDTFSDHRHKTEGIIN